MEQTGGEKFAEFGRRATNGRRTERVRGFGRRDKLGERRDMGKARLKVARRQAARAFAQDLSRGMNAKRDGRVLSFGEAEIAYNVSAESGALSNGYGLSSTVISSEYERIFFYSAYDETEKKNREMYLAYNGTDGGIYGGEGVPYTWTRVRGVTFASAPVGVQYRLAGEDVFLLCGREGMAVVHASLSAVTVPNAPDITSLAMHNERMFATVGGRRNAVWFSDDLDPTNWNPDPEEGGFVELEGEGGRLNRVVSFGGYVYVFRDYGIARISALGAQSDFSVSGLFVSSGRIYADTVAVCGDRILFLAEDGLYAFDGVSTGRIARHLDGLLAGGNPIGCYSAGKYYLSACSRESVDGRNDMLWVVDPRTKEVTVCKGIYVTGFSPVTKAAGEMLLARADGLSRIGVVKRCGHVFGVQLHKEWRSGMTDLGRPDARKIIREIYIDTKYACTVTVRTERGGKRFSFLGKDEVQKRRVNLIGTKVQLCIETDGDMGVARPTVLFSSLG